MISDFKGKTAVVTGAGSGLGLEFARVGARLGMKLVLVDIEEAKLASAARELTGSGARVESFRLDVSNAGEMQVMGQAVFERFGAPHLLLNNAGVASGGLIWESPVKDWEWVLGVNLMGVVHGVRIFTPMMLAAAQKDPDWHGHIVNTASMAGLLSTPNMGVYNVSKHAVVALSETLYQDLALVTSQVGASVLCPFFVATNIAQSHRNRPQDPESDTPTKSQLIERAMTGRAVSSGKVSAAQVAELVFDSIAANCFYIYSHPHAMNSVRTRMDDVTLGRNPTSPFAHKPEIADELKAALRAD